MIGLAIGMAYNCLKMLLKLGHANRTYKNIYQQFSFENEYNCFVTKF